VICLVTIHGIGFQQPPSPDGTVAGYADALHKYLRGKLGQDLGDDPGRRTLGQRGPVYVQSNWPPFEGSREGGLERLGSWVEDDRESLHVADSQELAYPKSLYSHVALVYSGLEEPGWDPSALLGLGTLAIPTLSHYSSVSGWLRVLFFDVEGLLHHSPKAPTGTPSQSIRRDRPTDEPRVRPDGPLPDGVRAAVPASVVETMRQIEADVGGYVARHDLRERVRGFVVEALTRLASRQDVDGLVINAHSNGSLISYDALRRLEPAQLTKVRAFITSGTPLRKCSTMMSWGSDCGPLVTIPRWVNLWDKHDPVADPLDPGGGWRRGDALPQDSTTHLFGATDDQGAYTPRAITDVKVDNLKHSKGGGLQAHNYWDNEVQVVPVICEGLRLARRRTH
jgi:hypothetical protein